MKKPASFPVFRSGFLQPLFPISAAFALSVFFLSLATVSSAAAAAISFRAFSNLLKWHLTFVSQKALHIHPSGLHHAV